MLCAKSWAAMPIQLVTFPWETWDVATVGISTSRDLMTARIQTRVSYVSESTYSFDNSTNRASTHSNKTPASLCQAQEGGMFRVLSGVRGLSAEITSGP